MALIDNLMNGLIKSIKTRYKASDGYNDTEPDGLTLYPKLNLVMFGHFPIVKFSDNL